MASFRARTSVFPPLAPWVYFRRPSRPPPFPLDDPHCRLFALARHGLWQGVKSLGMVAGDEVLAPAYHHGSEIEAFARAGLGCRFYEAHDSLEPDQDELDSLVGPSVRALHLVHYLGFPQDSARWRRWCDERELLLIEDAAQAWLARWEGSPVGSLADIAIFSLYKTVALPDGGAVRLKVPSPSPRPTRRLGLARVAKSHAAWLVERWALPARSAGRLAPVVPYDPEADFALGDPTLGPSAMTRFLLARMGDEAVAERRRQNYRRLLARLVELVPSPFDRLPDGACPLALPIESEEKGTLLRQLAARRLRGLNLWSVPHPGLPKERFPKAARRRARTLGLPVHQELSDSRLDWIAETVLRCSGRE